MRTATSLVFVPSFTAASVTVIYCPLVVPVRFTVIVFVPLPLVLATLAAPEVTDPPVKVTAVGKLKTT